MPERKSFSQRLMESWLWGPIGLSLAIIVGLAIIIVIFWHVITESGIPPGSDVTSFAHTAQYMVDYWRIHHKLPPIDLNWYAGFEISHAPPLIYLVLGSIYYFVHDILITERILHPLGIFIFFLGMFWLMKKEKYSTLSAFLAGIFFSLMPMEILTLNSQTKVVSLIFLPFAFYFTNKILTTNQIKYIAYLAIMIGLAIYGHPMVGYIAGISLVLYAILYAILDRQIVTRRFFFVILSVALGFLLASKYLIPFVLERAGRPSIAREEAIFNTSFLGFARGFTEVFGSGLFAFFVPTYVIWRRKEAKLTALYLVGLLSFLISCAYYFQLGLFFPFNQTYNYIWLYITAFVIAYLSGLVVSDRARNISSYFLRILIGMAVLAIFFFFITRPGMFINYLYNYKEANLPPGNDLTKTIDQIPNPGRIYISHQPFGWTIWDLRKTDKGNVEGHYFGIAMINKQISHVADAIHLRYSEYVIHKLKRFNIRYFIANNVLYQMKDPDKIPVGREFIKNLSQAGFKLILETTDFSGEKIGRLYYLNKPSTYVMPVEDKVLIIGKYAPTLAMAFSPAKIEAVESGSEYLDDYTPEFLRHYETVVLYGFSFHDKAKAEEIAREYVKGGGNLVIEMFNMDFSLLAQGPNFLGVTGLLQKSNKPINLEVNGGNPSITNSVPKTLDLPSEMYDSGAELIYVPLKEWRYLELAGLDQSLVKAPNDSDMFSVLGYKYIEGNKVTFVGMNFFYHLYLTHDSNELNLVTSMIRNNQNGIKQGARENSSYFEAKQEETTPNYMKFEISSEKERQLFISYAYSPHWKAYLNGQEVKIWRMEDLMLIQVPPGHYTLEIKYEETPVTWLAWVVTISTVMIILGLIVSSNYSYRKTKKSENLEEK